MKTRCRLSSMALLVLAGQALSAGGLAGFERDFDRIDRNGDGRISWPEFESRVVEMFYFADLDSDGYLSPQEAPPGVARQWERIDRDGDGRLGLAEFVRYHREMFRAADLDGDGHLSRAEVDALPRPRPERHR